MKDAFLEMSFEELVVKREELRRKLFEVRAKIKLGQITNAVEKRTLKRSIARLNTRIYNFVHTDIKE